MIQAANAVETKHHSAFHRVFATARWSRDPLGLAVFGLIQPWLDEGSVLLSLDDTLARKRGRRIFGVGMHHDPLLSTRQTALMNWGHSWVVLSVIVAFPFRPDHYFSLPILFRLYVNKKTAAQKSLRYRTRPELAVEMLSVLCQRHENRRFHVIGDSAYGGQSVLGQLPENCDLTSRLGLDARLYDTPPARKPGSNGRPRKRGRRRPTPRQMLEPRTRRLTLNIYGRRDRSRVADGVARVYAVPERPLRIVAVEPLTGGRKMQAFYSTCHEATAEQVLTWYAMRWSIEEAFHDAKGHLGFEQPQGWTRKAVERTAPTAMLLYSLIVLWFAAEGHRHYRAPKRPWYRSKSCASFVDMLNTLRCESVRKQVLSLGLRGWGSRNVMKTLFNAVQQAASVRKSKLDLAGADLPEAARQAGLEVDGRQERLPEHEPGVGSELLLFEFDLGDCVGLAFDAFSAILHGGEPAGIVVCVCRYAHDAEMVHLFNYPVRCLRQLLTEFWSLGGADRPIGRLHAT